MESNHQPKIKATSNGLSISLNPVAFLNAIIKAKSSRYLSAALEALKIIKKVTSKERLAFELIYNALTKACINLAREENIEKWEQTTSLATQNKGLYSDSKQQIDNLELIISKDFWNNPASLPFLKEFKIVYKKWLQETVAFPQNISINVGERLPIRFWRELDFEFREDRSKYAELETYFKDTPFTEGFENKLKMLMYNEEIKSFYHNTVFGDKNIRLSDIYIEPKFKIHKRNIPEGHEFRKEKKAFYQTNSYEKIHEYLNNYFFKRKSYFNINAEKAQIILLLGQPGQGKTSFCYRVVHDLLEDKSFNNHLIFVKLRELSNPRDFLKRPFEELNSHFRVVPFKYDNCIIILDGLDELFMIEGLTNNEINEFFRYLPKELANRPGINVIVTSRHHYILP